MVTKHKILVAVDGSEQSLAGVRYVAGVLSPIKTHITLLHIKTEIPEAFLDMDIPPDTTSFEGPIREWARQLQPGIEGVMANALSFLVAAGFSQESVSQVIVPRRTGYARDILGKTHEGYAALVIGRNGRGCFDEKMMGSIAAKLVESVNHIPVIVVGGAPHTEKIMVAYDKSSGTANAVNAIAAFSDTAKIQVLLAHIVRPLNMPSIGVPTFFDKRYERNWLDANTRNIALSMAKSKRELIESGVDAQRIATAILEEKTSRAEGLYAEALHHKVGTIVIGRRGLNNIVEFSMGRVTRKIMHMAHDRAVWIT